ncbi:MAG: tRNA (N6-isopentenyl adenosine(37)-C2)-methylthiotransferase MiaB [Sphaerochaeta sp.]
MNKFYIETYGCQMNTAESNAIQALLLSGGWVEAAKPEDADISVINTCSVRKSAENRIWGRLGLYKYVKSEKAKQGKSMTLVLTGCMADRLGDSLKKSAPQIDYVVGNNDKLRILEIAGIAGKVSSEHDKYSFTQAYYKEGDFASYVPIMNGCNNFCTYCIVPYVRGREISRCPGQILEEVKFLDGKGVREITLLGQNVNSYSYEGLNFPKLLEQICSVCDNIQWIRFESPHPKDFSDELIEVISREKRVAKHLHVPMQSGSTRILQLMNRRYTREQYLALIHKIQNRIPEMTFAVDVMVGFPGETQEDFKETLSAMAEVGCIEAYMYYWNPREGTKACDMENQIPEDIKQARLQALIDWQLDNAARIKAKRARGIQKVLVTRVSRDNGSQMLGRNEHSEMVAFDVLEGNSPGQGDMVDVDFKILNGNTFIGKQVQT